MSRLFIPLLFVFFLLSPILRAQNTFYFTQHRPAELNWQELNSPHFRIIFPKGFEEVARKSARILEDQYDQAYALTGGKLTRFPVVLSTYNDLTNGFVSSVNFRSEVDLAPFKGKSLNPKSGSWLEMVLPHELLHANHANVTNRFSLASAIGVLSPDFRRSFNLFPPLGVHEGLAVYFESEHGLHGLSGRSNYTYFNNQFNANLMGPNTWSMGQTLIPSDYTLPIGRHYISGSFFTKWLHDNYGDDVSKEAFRTHQNLFFLGYGYALKHVTGEWPGQLYQQYISDKNTEEQIRLSLFTKTTDEHSNMIGSPFKGVRQNRPVWISDDKLMYFSRQYNSPRGFYIYDLKTGKHKKLTERFIVGDFYMDYERDTGDLFIAENFSLNRIFSNYQTDLVRVNVNSGRDYRLTHRERVYAPEKTGSQLFAIQPQGDVSNIVEIFPDSVIAHTSFTERTPIAIKASNLDESKFAVVVNQRGIQALWIVANSSISEDLNRLPDVAFSEGSIHDPVWHPSENKLMFTVDTYPAMNVYEYDLDSGLITQITNSAYNAFEASYFEDGSKIAFVRQVDNQQLIGILNRENFFNRVVSDTELLTGPPLANALRTPFLGDELKEESESWEISSYRSDFGWLKPRAVLPVLKDKSGTNEWGIRMLSTDVLQSQRYSFELTGLQDQLWYNLSYTNRTFYPGMFVSAFREPSFTTLLFSDAESGEQFAVSSLIEERGMSAGIPIEYYFDKTDRFSSFFIRPLLSYNQLRYNDLVPEPISNFTTEWQGGVFAQFNVRLLQKPRDIQPSSGIQLFAQVDRVLNDTDLKFNTGELETETISLQKRWANYYGVNLYLAPFPKTNQSLLLSAQYLVQSDRRLFSNDTIIPFGFDDEFFFDSSSISRISGRYVIPLAYPDNGGLLLPFYLSNVYLSVFSHTLFNYDPQSFGNVNSPQTVLGTGLHFRFKVSNLAFDLGVGITYNPSTNTSDFILGSF